MLLISKAAIRKLAMNDTVYSRGLRYYNNHAVLNVNYSKSAEQYLATVKGKSEYQVTVRAEEKGTFSYHCNCPAACKYQGACKHVVAVLLFISDYVRRTEIGMPENEEEKNIYRILEHFGRNNNIRFTGEIFHLHVQLTIPSLLKENTGKAYLSLQAGRSRLYKIQALKKFLADYGQKNNISLGKEFNFISGESRFDENATSILDYLMEIYEIQESLGRVYYSNLFSKSQLTLTKNMLLKLLRIMGQQLFDLDLYGKHFEQVTFVERDPELYYEIHTEDNAILLDYTQEESPIPVADTGELLFFRHSLYHPKEKFIRNYVPFYHLLGKERKPLCFKGKNKKRFLESVLPQIYETMLIDIPEDMKEQYVKENLSVNLFLDKYRSGIKAILRFSYGKYEFNPMKYTETDNVIVIRQREKEEEVFQDLEKLGFEPWKEFYLLKEEEAVYHFLSSGIQNIQNKYDVFYSDSFRNIKIQKPGRLYTHLSFSPAMDLLEMDFDFEEIPKEELKELFHSFQLKKKYHRLQNGNFLQLDPDSADKMADIFSYLDITSKNLSKDKNKFLLPKNNAFYLDSILSENDLVTVVENKTVKELISRIRQPEDLKISVPDTITAVLRPYQETGFRWLKSLSDNGFGGILADDMGLGKTLQTIVYIAGEQIEKKGVHFIVCPSSLVYNWQDEFENFAPSLKTLIVKGTPEERRKQIAQYQEADVLITSYPLIRRDLEYYKDIHFSSMFIDEAQFIKNPGSYNAKSVKKVKACHKFALTGTPIENTLSELWSIFDYIMQGYLFGHARFIKQYEKPIVKEENKEVLSVLEKRIRPFVLRRMKQDVLKELPKKTENKIMVELTEAQKKVYLSYLEHTKNELGKEMDEAGIEKNRFKILAVLTRLRQICCHPATFIENYKGGSGKIDLLLEILPSLIENGRRILIFSQFTSMLDILKREFAHIGIDCFLLQGNVSMEERSSMVKRFNGGEKQIFLISLKAGGTGLNLTGADTVIHFDPWWNPAVEEQAADRAYRIGQENPVQVMKLITKGTIEEKIYKLQKQKKELSESVIHAKEVFLNQLSKEEIKELFKY